MKGVVTASPQPVGSIRNALKSVLIRPQGFAVKPNHKRYTLNPQTLNYLEPPAEGWAAWGRICCPNPVVCLSVLEGLVTCCLSLGARRAPNLMALSRRGGGLDGVGPDLLSETSKFSDGRRLSQASSTDSGRKMSRTISMELHSFDTGRNSVSEQVFPLFARSGSPQNWPLTPRLKGRFSFEPDPKPYPNPNLLGGSCHMGRSPRTCIR